MNECKSIEVHTASFDGVLLNRDLLMSGYEYLGI